MVILAVMLGLGINTVYGISIDYNDEKADKMIGEGLYARAYVGGAYYDGTYYCVACKQTGNKVSEITTWEQYGYGTYEWYALMEGESIYKQMYLGFGEEFSGQSYDRIFVYYDRGTYKFSTGKGGNYVYTELKNMGWTEETKFKVDWQENSCKLFVDDIEVAHHTKYVPDCKMVKFIEVLHFSGATTKGYVKARGLFD